MNSCWPTRNFTRVIIAVEAACLHPSARTLGTAWHRAFCNYPHCQKREIEGLQCKCTFQNGLNLVRLKLRLCFPERWTLMVMLRVQQDDLKFCSHRFWLWESQPLCRRWRGAHGFPVHHWRWLQRLESSDYLSMVKQAGHIRISTTTNDSIEQKPFPTVKTHQWPFLS